MGKSSWIDDLLELLCRIYKAWGGDCSDFEGDAHKAVVKLVGVYSTLGAPTFTSPAARLDFLKQLDGLAAHLDLAENSLEPSDTIALLGLIENLRKDLA